MESERMLHNMCHEVLSTTDINAIRKSRNFSAKETASKALLENFYLTDIGVEAAMSLLTHQEICALHLLKMHGEAVQVSFFERLYQGEPSGRLRYGHRTFSQRFQAVFKQVRTSLVRRGILILAEAGTSADETKMERWRFLLPQQFEPFLPPLFPDAATLNKPGTVNEDVLHNALSGTTFDSKPASWRDTEMKQVQTIHLSSGSLLIGTKPFSEKLLHEWLQSKWRTVLNLSESTDIYYQSVRSKYVSPVDAVYYALAQLAPNQWVTPQQIDSILYIFSGTKFPLSQNEHPGADEICKAGWQWGQLAHSNDGTADYYRLAPTGSQADGDSETDDEPAVYLKTQPDGVAHINLRKIRHSSLDLLARVSDLALVADGVTAKPNLVKMGKVPLEKHSLSPLKWLGQNSSLYEDALSTVEKQWGKQILHTNLLVARISDLSLKAAIEKAFAKSDEIQHLPNNYIAFPPKLLPKVERAVQKAGHVVKTVSGEDQP